MENEILRDFLCRFCFECASELIIYPANNANITIQLDFLVLLLLSRTSHMYYIVFQSVRFSSLFLFMYAVVGFFFWISCHRHRRRALIQNITNISCVSLLALPSRDLKVPWINHFYGLKVVFACEHA